MSKSPATPGPVVPVYDEHGDLIGTVPQEAIIRVVAPARAVSKRAADPAALRKAMLHSHDATEQARAANALGRRAIDALGAAVRSRNAHAA